MTTFDLDLVIQASRCVEQEEGASERLRFDLKKIQSQKDSIKTEDVKEVSKESIHRALAMQTMCPDDVLECVIQKYNEIVEQY